MILLETSRHCKEIVGGGKHRKCETDVGQWIMWWSTCWHTRGNNTNLHRKWNSFFSGFLCSNIATFLSFISPRISKCYNQFLGFIIWIFHYLFCLIFFINLIWIVMLSYILYLEETAILFNTICLRICFIVGTL